MSISTNGDAPLSIDEISFGGERVTHLVPNDVYFAHLSIYHFALQFCRGKSVLDAGSGAGYGSAYLADNGAKRVVAFDIEENAVIFSRYHFPRPNLTYQPMSIETIKGFSPQSFDVIFSSNALEHVPNVYPFFHSAWELLEPGGKLIIAVPPVVNDASRDANLSNPYHLNIWTPRQWFHVLSLYFSDVQPYLHGFDKSGVELDFNNTPGQTRINEADFFFESIALDDFYNRHTLTVMFVARNPRPKPDLLAIGSPLEFVDDSFTRPLHVVNTQDVAGTTPSFPLIARAFKVAQQQGLRTLLQKGKDYLIAKLQGTR